MYFTQLVKRLTIDVFLFLALALNVFFIVSQMVPFITSAVKLNTLNAQTISYIAFTFLLTLLPMVLLLHNMRFSKRNTLGVLFYIIAGIILVGSVADLIKYSFFTEYVFAEGDAVFVNIMWNMPNMLGTLFSAVISVLYAILGGEIKKSRRRAYILFLVIVTLCTAVPFLYTWVNTGYLPRQTYIEKQAMIVPEYWLITVALTICVTSRRLWMQHVWDY